MPDATYGSYPEPRPLATHEILDVVEDYRLAAINAIEAGLLVTYFIITITIYKEIYNKVLYISQCSSTR